MCLVSPQIFRDSSVKGGESKLEEGVEVIKRTDYNYTQVAQDIKDAILRYERFTPTQVTAARKAAGSLSKKALWKSFVKPYYEAYAMALEKAEKRMNNTNNQ